MRLMKELAVERRKKSRFPMSRDLRYKVLKNNIFVDSGTGTTVDLGSGGVAFTTDHHLPPGAFIELSISWPVLLENACPMRLIVFGKILRGSSLKTVCTISKYEFRTQARAPVLPIRTDAMLQRWVESNRKELTRTASV